MNTINNDKLQFSNSVNTNNSGKLHLIIGPMFAGKTSHLVENYNKCKLCNNSESTCLYSISSLH